MPRRNHRHLHPQLPKLQAHYVAQPGHAASGSGPEVVADAVLHALTRDKPRTRYPVGDGAKRMLMLRRLLPDRRFDRIILKAAGLA